MADGPRGRGETGREGATGGAAGHVVERVASGFPLYAALLVSVLTAVDETVAAVVGPAFGKPAAGDGDATAGTRGRGGGADGGGSAPPGGGDAGGNNPVRPADHVCWLGFRRFVSSTRAATQGAVAMVNGSEGDG